MTPSPVKTSVQQLEAEFARRPSLLLGERIKCLRLRHALASLGIAAAGLPADCHAPRIELGLGEALVSFFAHAGRLHRFVRMGSRTHALPALPLTRIEPWLIKARDELELGDLDPAALAGLRRLLAGARQRLLGDLEPLLGDTRHLVVLPDGLVRHLPLHALEPGAPPSHRSYSYLPCLALHRPPVRPPNAARLFLPGYGRAATPMKGAIDETHAAARQLGQATVLAGEQATAPAMLAALGRRGIVVHFAGHGLPALDDDQAPGPSELILSGGEVLTAAAIARAAPLSASLVVLASCATAYPARFRDGKRLVSPVSLVEVLLAAGVRSVIAASWTVKDHESARQVRILYRQLGAAGPAAALGRVYRDRWRAIHPPHPRFWGAYALYGAWRWSGPAG